MNQQQRILDATQELTLSNGKAPSILEVARAVGLTKQGVLHYFPNRAALDAAVVLRALARVDAAMAEAAASGSPTATYLHHSSPDAGDRAALMVLAAAYRGRANGLPPEVGQTIARWEALIATELGDPVRAEVVRLVGDGLFGEALATGTPPTGERIERLVTHLRASSSQQGA
jgi:AcrR family transcriptional regulator